MSVPGNDRAAFAAAVATLSASAVGADLCGPFIGVAGAEGASVSTLGRPLGTETVCASNALAARIDEIQIDFGEGPCWDALSNRRPVLESDLRRSSNSRWPNAREAFRELDIGAIFAFPLYVGDVNVGSVDLYTATPRVFSSRDVTHIAALAEIASRLILRRALDGLGNTDDGLEEGPHSRRQMHQASGMVAAQLGIGVDDALLVLRGRAYSSGRTVAAIAADVIDRRVAFDISDS